MILVCHFRCTADSFKFGLNQASLVFKIPVKAVYIVDRHFPFLYILFVAKHIMEEGGMVVQAAVPPTRRRVLPPTQRRALAPGRKRAGKSRNAESPSGPPDASVGRP